MTEHSAPVSTLARRAARAGLLILGVAAASGCASAPDTSAEPVVESADEPVTTQTPANVGGVLLVKDPTGAGFVVPSFTRGTATTIEVDRVGRCTVRRNQHVASGPPASAGEIRVVRHDGSLAASVVPLPNGAYVPAFVAGPALWADEEVVSVTAAGAAGGVPAFSAKVRTVAPIQVTQPVAAADGSFTLSRGSDLRVRWTGAGATGAVNVLVSNAPPPSPDPVDPNATYDSVECNFEVREHEGTVPARALAYLRAGGGFVQILPQSRRSKRPGAGWLVDVVCSSTSGSTLPATIQ